MNHWLLAQKKTMSMSPAFFYGSLMLTFFKGQHHPRNLQADFNLITPLGWQVAQVVEHLPSKY
jgi:hypothetical protein